MSQIDIDRIFCPKKDKLIKKNKDGEIVFTAQIVDAEIDTINCTFNYDNCVEINTENLTYITLTISNLLTLIDLIQQAEAKYTNHFKKLEKLEK